jgi:hypothetical protein
MKFRAAAQARSAQRLALSWRARRERCVKTFYAANVAPPLRFVVEALTDALERVYSRLV